MAAVSPTNTSNPDAVLDAGSFAQESPGHRTASAGYCYRFSNRAQKRGCIFFVEQDKCQNEELKYFSIIKDGCIASAWGRPGEKTAGMSENQTAIFGSADNVI
jgi:hypothetical protein